MVCHMFGAIAKAHIELMTYWQLNTQHKLLWNFDQNMKIFFDDIVYENVPSNL